MKKIVFLVTLFCAVFMITGCDLLKKDSASSNSAKENESSKSGLAARDEANSVVCTMEDPVDNSTYRKLLELIGQDSGKTYTGYAADGTRIYTGEYDQFLEDRDIVIGKKYTQKVFKWNKDESRIIGAYRIITHEFTDDKVTSEMLEAMKKSMEDELKEERNKDLYEATSITIDGRKVIADLKIDISDSEEKDVTQSKQTIFNNNDGEYYHCQIK